MKKTSIFDILRSARYIKLFVHLITMLSGLVQQRVYR